jgi:hypothetical protein
MKKTLLTSAVILGIAGLVSLAHAREDSQGYGLNFETEVGGIVGTLFGDRAKEENGILLLRSMPFSSLALSPNKVPTLPPTSVSKLRP